MAGIIGIIGGSIMFILGILWLSHREKGAREKGEGFGEEHDYELSVTP